MKLSIITPVFNNLNFTKSYINDLSKLPKDHEIIIVDNGSTDGTEDYFKSLNIDNLVYIKNKLNEGFARGSNKPFKNARGEYILFLNNDIRVKENYANWTENLIKAAEDGSLVGPTAGVLDNYFNFVKEIDKIELNSHYYISGWCLCAKKTTFEKLVLPGDEGPFSTEFTSYFEDTDLSFRAKELNIQFKIIPVPVHHFGRMTGKKLNLPELYLNGKKIFTNKWITKTKNF